MHRIFNVVVIKPDKAPTFVSGPWASREDAEESKQWFEGAAVDGDDFWQDASITIDERSSESVGMTHPNRR